MNSSSNIVILGSTGSIGTSTLDVIRNNKEKFRIVCLTANENFELLSEQINEFKPEYAYLEKSDLLNDLKKRIQHNNTKLLININDIFDLISSNNCEVIVSAMSGSSGLSITYKALLANKKILLANKESMVMAGHLLKEFNKNIIPIDSEHNSIFQVLDRSTKDVSKIILTASGGPFKDFPKSDFKNISKEMALKHPNWTMGEKITIDSATMMNKCLEIIEAFYLFEINSKKIDVIVHPESIIHSIVDFLDGSSICQFSEPNMNIPISYALGYPNRINSGKGNFDLTTKKNLTFLKPDFEKFPSLKYAFNVLGQPEMCLKLNAANELAVDYFLSGRIAFNDIFNIIEESLDLPLSGDVNSLESILDSDENFRCNLLKKIHKFER
jgi:1-deoxy-D-xylulose-5-phosphate reductoisomerase